MYGGLIHPQLKLKECIARARTGKQKIPLQPLSTTTMTIIAYYYAILGLFIDNLRP